MQTKWRLLAAALWLGLLPGAGWAQNFTPELKVDPDLGNVLGVQRFGRPLRSDPDGGEGYSYRVFPIGFGPSTPPYKAFVPLRQMMPLAEPEPAIPAGPALPVAGRNEGEKKFTINPPYMPGTPYDSTQGLRNYAVTQSMAEAMTFMGVRPDPTTETIIHEPLIQIKVRVIDVERSHELDTSSVLDYISLNPANAKASFITGNNLNSNKINTTAASRFTVPGLLSVNGTALGTGQGFVLNLTSKHINYIASLLQTELHGDLITAPQVTTLNNQNVEFFAGSKQPFTLGQNVTTGETNNIQQFYYKHVGAYISVTPRLVNWNLRKGHGGEGWPTKSLDAQSCDECKRWRANDCTIDLSIVVRLSDTGTSTVMSNGQLSDLNFENNIRAIANVVQVKSGEGVVMAGLIGEQDQKVESKIPFLGDIPVAGFLFRDKTTARKKTETLIFVEAKVLDTDPCVARQQTYEDFLLGQPYVAGGLLENPLEEGMYRSGFGTYLPPLCPAEERYWDRLGRKIRNVATKLDDITE